MTPIRQKFIDEYITTGNAAEAARRAGYSAKYANRQGSKLLADKFVRAEIDKRLAEIKTANILDETSLLEFLSSVVRADFQEESPINTGKIIRHKIPTAQRLKAAELLLKIGGAFEKKEKPFDNTIEIISVDGSHND